MSSRREPWQSDDGDDEAVIPLQVANDTMFRAKYLYLASRCRENALKAVADGAIALNDITFERHLQMVLPMLLLQLGVGVALARLVTLVDGPDAMSALASEATLFLQGVFTLTGFALFLWRDRQQSRKAKAHEGVTKRKVERELRHLARLVRVRDAFERQVRAREES